MNATIKQVGSRLLVAFYDKIFQRGIQLFIPRGILCIAVWSVYFTLGQIFVLAT